jgi:O-antigen/teichoic acid export membrane protein
LRNEGVSLSNDSSLKGRFVSKLTSNLTSVLLGLITIAVVPRALGPADYGRFEFLAANFKLILDSLTLHLPSAFYNWISRKAHKEDADVSTAITLYGVSAAVFLFGLIIAFAVGSGYSKVFWPEIAPVYLWEAYALTVAAFIFQMCTYLADGKALTVGLEKLRLMQNFIKTVTYLALVWFGLMNLHQFFCSQIMIAGFGAFITVVWLYRKKAFSLKVFNPWRFPHADTARYYSFLKAFVRPLIVLVSTGFLFNYFDKWFLQLIGGPSEYGYFGLSDRLGAVAIIFTSAMTPLLSREFALAHEEMDKPRLSRLFERIKIFLFIAATASCFLSMNSVSIVEIIGGDKFRGAIIPIGIMALYPIHQTFGQLSASLMIATGQTSLYSKIAIFCMFVSIPVTYFLIAPGTFLIPGLEWGATGLAIKMVAVNIVGTNIQLYYNTKYIGISFPKWVFLQLKLVVLLYTVASIAYFVTGRVSEDILLPLNFLHVTSAVFLAAVRFFMSGLMYMASVIVLVITVPQLTGIDRDELIDFFGRTSLGKWFLKRKGDIGE